MATEYSEQLRLAAEKAGIVDIDALALADLSKDDGTAQGADELVATLREAKPHLFQPKMARDMTPEERDRWWAEHKKKWQFGGPPEPMPVDRKAKDMSSAEREEWLAEHRRRFG